MALKVGINGFGRIGRLVLRAAMLDKDIEFVGINDLVPAENLAYLLKYDSTHGRAKVDISADGERDRDQRPQDPVLSVKDPAELPWAKLGPLRRRVHRPVHRSRGRAEAPDRRRQARHHLRPGQGQGHPDVRDGRQRGEVQRRRRTRSCRTPAARPTAWPRSSRWCSTTSASTKA